MGELTFILGPARSGKSALAVDLAKRHGGRVLYIATLEPLDDEMRERAARHRDERPTNWATLEEPLDLPRALSEHTGFDVYLLDCATVWVSNLLLREQVTRQTISTEVTGRLLRPVSDLIEWQQSTKDQLIVVSNEVGAGIVPEYPLGRAYRDALGRANQILAAAADRFYYAVAGFYLDLKATGARQIGHREY